MNRKQFVVLLVLVAVLGGAVVMLLKKNSSAWESGGERTGRKLIENFPVNDISVVNIRDAGGELSLERGEQGWTVRQRDGYPANYSMISDLLLKFNDLKVLESETVEASQLARLELVPPSEANGSGIQVEFRDDAGRVVRSVIIGKQQMKKTSQSSPFGDGGRAVGRYILVGGDSKRVNLVADPINEAQTDPGQWLNKEFFRVERALRLRVSFPAADNSWTLTRESDSGSWLLADAREGEALDAGKIGGIANPLAYPSFVDVAGKAAETNLGSFTQTAEIRLETAGGFHYTLKVGEKTEEGNYRLMVDVTANLPEDGGDAGAKEQRAAKLKQESMLSGWVFEVSSWIIEPLLKERGELMVKEASAGEDTAAEAPES